MSDSLAVELIKEVHSVYNALASMCLILGILAFVMVISMPSKPDFSPIANTLNRLADKIK